MNKFNDDQMPQEYVDLGFSLWEFYQFRLQDHCNDDGKPYFGGEQARINIEDDPSGNDVIGEQTVEGRDTSLWFGAMFPDGITQEAKLGTYKFDKMHTPAELVYPYTWDSNLATRRLNYGVAEYTTASTERTTSGVLSQNNKQRVQFTFASPELYCCGDKIAEVNPTVFGVGADAIGDRGRFGGANGQLRNFPRLCSQLTFGSKGGNIPAGECGSTLLGSAISRNADHSTVSATSNFGNGAMAAMCRGLVTPAGIENIIPFDCYINSRPTNSPRNAPALFGGDTGPESGSTTPFQGGDTPSQYVGANAVSII